MKCFNHETTDAVGTCQSCGKTLCKECAAKYNPCMCDDCYDKNIRQDKEEKIERKKDALMDTHAEFGWGIIKGFALILVLPPLLNAFNDENLPLSSSLFFFFAPFGWSFLTYLEAILFPILILPIPFHLIYLLVKLLLATFLGIPLFFIQVAMYIYKVRKLKKE